MVSSVCFHFYSLKSPCSMFLVLNPPGISQLATIGSTLTLGYHQSEKRVCKGLYFSPACEVVGPTSWGPFLVLNKEVANVVACKSLFFLIDGCRGL